MYHDGPKTREGRRRKLDFQAVLRVADETASAWAARHGVAKSHLSQVLDEIHDSRTLLNKVDAYIAWGRSCLQDHHCRAVA